MYKTMRTVYASTSSNINCDWIYGIRSKSHIGSYEIVNFKDFSAKPAKD